MKDIWMESAVDNNTKKINKKKLLVTTLIIIITIFLIIIVGLYYTNRQARDWIDKNIFRKEVIQDSVDTIDLKEGENVNIYAFNKYIGILNKTKFSIYGSTGNEEKTLDIQISNPIFHSENRFLAIAENNGKKIYLISDKDIVWNTEVEGNISQIYVNKNGYVAVVMEDTIYKSVIAVYDPNGTRMFKNYLSFTKAVDVSISNDNKYLAIAEVDTSGTMVQSSVKIISIEKASTDPTNFLDNTYKSEQNKLITKIKYQDKNNLVCMYTDSICEIENGQNVVLTENKDKKVIFECINLSNYVCSIEEKSSGLFTADSLINIINVSNKDVKQYVADSITKEVFTYGNIIALNLGTEIEFIDVNGLLVKRYIANQEITNIVVSDNIAGIIYRDKIDIVNL